MQNNSSQKLVYFFGNKKADGTAQMRALLGGKGANLAEMTNLGLPVPPGFTITTDVCIHYLSNQKKVPDDLKSEVDSALKKLSDTIGFTFGNAEKPLLVSVRSGAQVSMPGMMETILNLGLNDESVEGLARLTQNRRFAYDCYRRFIQMFGNVVDGIDSALLEEPFERLKIEKKYRDDTEVTEDDLVTLCKTLKSVYLKKAQKPFPQDAHQQLWSAIGAVFDSWNCARAIKYREIHNMPHHYGTAVNICTMVYGNMGSDCGTGVCFTRNPSTGVKELYGEYLVNAQGEDVVAGIRTPKPVSELQKLMPGCYDELLRVTESLEKHYRDAQDIEFTIQNGQLFLLQTRNAKRTALASMQIALDFVKEKFLTQDEALMRINPEDLNHVLHPTLDPKAKMNVLTKGLPASPGAASGKIVFTADTAEAWAARGEAVILVRHETSPEDIGGMHVSRGFLTARGGMTSHAAVVARQMGKCCVAGCSDLVINYEKKEMSVPNKVTLKEGDWLTIEGSTGEVMLGRIETREPEIGDQLKAVLNWSKGSSKMKVFANADTPHDAALARSFGAVGIGLCRTEHMFFDENRLPIVRKMILSETKEQRQKCLDDLLEHQRKDFEGILEAMEGYPVTIRLLDPPLHEFLPHSEKEMQDLSTKTELSFEFIRTRAAKLKESNPMLGHRGCRLAISYPEIYEMQVRAIAEATIALHKKKVNVKPEIMIPLVGLSEELKWLRERLSVTLNKVIPQSGIPIGTMIELPRACLVADEIAEHADFFSFGTNDLTQTTFGFSRDDSGEFLTSYESRGVLNTDPFQKIDTRGVGKLMDMAVTLGRKTKQDLKIGVCGEHGGEPSSIAFCRSINLNYVSCSPYRVPIAILSAAQTELKNKNR